MRDAFSAIRQVLTRGWKRIGKKILKSCRGYLEDVGQTHWLEVILRVAGLPINFDDIPTDDESEITPEPRSMHFTDADWYSFYDSGLSFTDMLV
jgi:hypothetical protein